MIRDLLEDLINATDILGANMATVMTCNPGCTRARFHSGRCDSPWDGQPFKRVKLFCTERGELYAGGDEAEIRAHIARFTTAEPGALTEHDIETTMMTGVFPIKDEIARLLLAGQKFPTLIAREEC